MLRITAVSAGAVDYLIRGSGCTDHDDHGHHRQAGREAGLVAEHDGAGASAGHSAGGGAVGDAAGYLGAAVRSGEAPGRWMGSGLAMVGVDVARPAGEGAVRAVFGRLQHPQTGESLGRAPRRFKTYQQRLKQAVEREPLPTPERLRELELTAKTDGRKAVAYYDFTFSPVKSVSVYYAALLAAGLTGEAELVVAAHRDAVAIAMAYAEKHIAYTRVGYHGRTEDGRSVGRYEAAEGLVMTGWEHSTNREGEPQLHTHVAVLNRAVTTSDRRIRALDGRGFRPIKEAIATIYERGIERGLRESLGVVFATRPDGIAREILGVAPELCAEASTRRAQVLDRLGELVAEYEQRHGRAPDAAARKALAQAATLDTRAAKHDRPAGPAAVLAWAQQRGRVMAATVNQVATAATRVAVTGHPDTALRPAARDRTAMLAAAVADVQARYASWTVGNLIAAIDRQLGDLNIFAPDRPAVLEGLAGHVLAADNPFGVLRLTAADPVAVPDMLRRPSDGRSVFRPHIDERYATTGQLAMEVRVVATARAVTAPAIPGQEAELLRVELVAAGLSPDQVDAVVGIAGSGRAGDVLIGPAGAGKSRTVATLARVWEQRFGGRVWGLATSQRATDVLTDDGLEALNTTAFLHRFTPDGHGGVRERGGRGDLFIVDEAAMTATAELDRITELVRAGGGKLVFTGDHHQLASVGAGGVLELLAADNGAFELARIHRFTAAWEGPASARLRTGDVTVLAEYEDRGRLQGGTVEQMHTAAVRGYLADTLSGYESLLVVGTNADAARLSVAIREELIILGRVAPAALARLRDGSPVSAGDLVQARRNDPSILVRRGVAGTGASLRGVSRFVTNRETYRVLGRRGDGGLVVVDPDGGTAHLPAGYVAAHLTLAYASTVYAAQGRTVDTAHAVLGEQAHREDAYVALTRGRERNTAYLTTTRPPDAHDQERLTGTPVGRLAAILDRTSDSRSAELQRRVGQRDGASLAWIGGIWDQVSAEYARDRYTDVLTALLPAQTMDRLVAEPGFPRLIRAVRAAELAGHHPEPVLTAAVGARHGGLDSAGSEAGSVADVLRWRVRLQTRDRVPKQRVDPADWTTWSPPLSGPVGQFAHDLAVLATDRQAQIGRAAAVELPEWATTHLGPPPPDPGERDRWIRAAGVAGAYRELAAVPEESVSLGAAPSREQELHRAMWGHAATALGLAADDGTDCQAAPDAQLYERVARWEREQTWAPDYVAPQLQQAHTVAEQRRRDAVLGEYRLATIAQLAPQRAGAAAEVIRAHREARDACERARQLETIHTQRGAWSQATQTVQQQARLAAEELTRRGLPVHPPTPSAERLATVEDLDSPVAGQHAGTHSGGELVTTLGRGQAGAALPAAAPEPEQAPDGHAPSGSSGSPGRRPPTVADPMPGGVSDWFEESFRAREQTRTLRSQLRQQARELEQGRIRRDACTAARDRLDRDAEAAVYEEAERERLYRGTQHTVDTSHDLNFDHGVDYDDQ